MQEAIDSYFEQCEEDKRPYTITGLANSLNLTREGLLGYQERDEFADTVKRAKSKVHQWVEEYLFTGKNTAGAIFNLKNNFSWVDKQDHSVDGNLKITVIDYSTLSDQPPNDVSTE